MLRWEWGVRLCARVGCVRGCGAQGAVKAARHPFFREKKSEAREGGEVENGAAHTSEMRFRSLPVCVTPRPS